jgi:hypothetical protein
MTTARISQGEDVFTLGHLTCKSSQFECFFILYHICCQSLVPISRDEVPPKQNSWSHPQPTESETLEVGPSKLRFNMPCP